MSPLFNDGLVDSSNLSPADSFEPLGWYLDQPLWVRDVSTPGNAAHNYPLSIHIQGVLNRETLECSLQEVVRRHGVLRSVFRIVEGKLCQSIMPPQSLSLPVSDLSNIPEAERRRKASELLTEDATRPFNLSNGPMLRLRLVRLGPEDHVLLLTTHHVVCDDWSIGILLYELFGIYEAFHTGKPSPFPELSYQYSDFVRRMHQQLQGTGIVSRLAFWTQHLRGASDFHHVLTDHVRPLNRTYRGTHERANFPKEVRNAIELIGRSGRASSFMVLLAALYCLLQRYSGEEDIGVGSCVANRPLVQLEGLIGPLANVTVLRTDLSGNPTFREVLRRVRDVALAAYSYQDLPFGTMLKSLQMRQDSSKNPSFQTLFVLLDAPHELWHVPTLSIEPYPLDTGTTRYELNLWVRMQEGVEVDLQYNSDLFEADTARKILRDYRVVLETISRNQDVRLRDIAISRRESQTYCLRTHREDVATTLEEMWKSVLGLRTIRLTDDFFELGGTSLKAVRLFAQIEEAFGVRLSFSTLLQAATIRDLSTVIRNGGVGTRSSLVEIQPGCGDRPPLFCIHGQSGSLLMYRNLAKYLGPDQTVYGLQPEGIDGGPPLLRSVEDMAAAYVKSIRAVQPYGPYFMVGFCMGGTIALEMAQQLRTQDETIGLLAMLETYNWGKVKTPSWRRNVYYSSHQWWLSGRHFLQMPSGAQLKALKVRIYEWINRHEFSEHNKRAALSYVPAMYPGRILHVSPINQGARYSRPEASWDKFALDGVENFYLANFPGQMLEEPYVRTLATKLRSCIEAKSGKSNLHQGVAPSRGGAADGNSAAAWDLGERSSSSQTF